MDKNIDQNLRLFIDESMEHLSVIENELLSIERSGSDIDENLVNKVYRAAHSIKGGAGFMGFTNIKNLTHEMENVLGKIRSCKLVPDTDVINILLLASDALRNLFNNIEKSEEADINEHMESLKLIIIEESPKQKQCAKKESELVSTEINNISFPKGEFPFSIPEEDILHDIRKEGKYIYIIQFTNIEYKALSGIIDDMKQCGVILNSKPELSDVVKRDTDETSADISLIVMFTTVLEQADVSQLLDSQKATIYIVNENNTIKPVADKLVKEVLDSDTADMPNMEKENSVEGTVDTGVNPPLKIVNENNTIKPVADKLVKETFDSDTADMPNIEKENSVEGTVDTGVNPPLKAEQAIKTQHSIRVNIELLDSLMTLAGELVLSRNQLLQSIVRNDRRAIEVSGQRIDLITSDLQEAIMHTRMQPIRNIFSKFPRVIRDIATSLNKKINLFMEGEEVELDKTIIEHLNDPMTHLIRNAADHGIEFPEMRVKQGKEPVGNIHLKAFHKAGQVNIEISDDGKGIDGEKIAEVAVTKGLVSEELVRGMSHKEKLNLIFLPGFSMSDKITDLSGRGVGMDVVKTNLESLGGIIDIYSEPKKRTTIRIKLPLTLAIIPCLLVSDGNERYAIPQINVLELIRIPPSQIKERIERIGEAHIIRIRDERFPLLRLSELLGIEYIITDRKQYDVGALPYVNERRGVNIVIVSTGSFNYGIIVDKLHDFEEIVVKPIGRHLRDCIGYAGAAILGDGCTALILDVANLAKITELATISGYTRKLKSIEKDIIYINDLRALLLFSNSEKTRFAVPLEQIKRIEKIKCRDIENIGGERVIRFGDSSIPLFDVGDVAMVDKFEEKENALVIVFSVVSLDIGILATSSIDTIRTAYRLETTLKQPGILGSVVIDKQTTLILDIIGIVEAIHPEWITYERPKSQEAGETKTVILAEDSKFFRIRMKCAIEDAGYNVIDAEDGMIAWNLLQKNADSISLVVTDLEMPNMDGFDFTRKIRKSDRFSHLPVIAVTSLTSAKDVEKAKKSGIDKFQIKLDTEKLVECINYYVDENKQESIQELITDA